VWTICVKVISKLGTEKNHETPQLLRAALVSIFIKYSQNRYKKLYHGPNLLDYELEMPNGNYKVTEPNTLISDLKKY
jgi:hypothetical protein